MSTDPPDKDHSRHAPSKSNAKKTEQLQSKNVNSSMQNSINLPLPKKKQGIFTPNHLFVAGFEYTGERDTARCEKCGLKVSNWTKDMDPYKIHSERSPDCSVIQSIRISSMSNKPSSSLSTTAVQKTSKLNEHENPSKRQNIETRESEMSSNTLLETNSIQQVRRHTFFHWPHRDTPSNKQMIEAGFFNCNVGDRVICIYCNLICQQWTPHTDDPCEVHKTLSPNCIYVKAKLIHPSGSVILIVNESSANITPTNEIVYTAACNSTYAEIPKRHASFATWPNENLPSVDDLVRAGFFYTGTKTIVTCFYCNGSLQNWGPNDNPKIEHARWFPHCAYAKQLCGPELYRKIQESKRAQQERARATEANAGIVTNNNPTTNNRQLLIPDESTLSRLVSARLDLPVSQRLLDQKFKLSVIKRCWEDQLLLKQDDFIFDDDLYMACLILQKQIKYIDGKKENIVIPSIKMEQIREQNEALISSFTPVFRPSRDIISDGSTSNEQGNLFMHQQPDTTDSEDSSNTCFESNSIQQVRKRTFSHWLHGTSPSSRQLIKAGFSYCNDGDRVICIYCYLICHQWTPHVYDPFEVHKTFSPNCPYVKSLLVRHRPQHIISNNDSITIPTAVHPDPQVVPQVATVDDYIQPTYFNTNLENNVTCPSCNRAFRNLDPDENPMIDHARQFPHCVYVKQLRGIEIYRQIHESNRAQQGHADVSNETLFTNDGQLLIVNENNIPRLVADRLNWLISQTLLNRSYSLSIITQCWEDQLRLKGEDFVTDLDLEMACLIRQTINDYINSANENIIITSESMRQLREHEMKAQAEELARIREAKGLTPRGIIPSSSMNVYESHNETTAATESTADNTKTKSQLDESTPSNPCVLCLTEEKRLACIPCGHLATCVPCGRSLRSCPICRTEIDAFVRIYL